MGGQEHFYLETGGSLVIPREDEYEVFSSCQNMRELQEHVAEVLGIPSNRVTARVKRLGGGFGGKETRPVHLAGCLAVAAQKTGQPIRCSLDRDEDIMTTGQRHPALAKYTVGVDEEGKLQALKLDCFVNGGYSLDISSGVLERMMAHADGPYKCPSTFIRGRICKTNTVCKPQQQRKLNLTCVYPANTAFRGFGGPQGLLTAEGYISDIAHRLNIPIDELRHRNLYHEGMDTHYQQTLTRELSPLSRLKLICKDYHVPQIIEDVRAKTNYAQRRQAIDEFNAKHRFRKVGGLRV
jgi:xanthine dehydrogenase/oxidase